MNKKQLIEKLDYLQTHHMKEWLEARTQADNEVSDAHPVWCICKRLATGFHQNGCGRFQTRVNETAVRKLKHLLKNSGGQ